MSAPKDPYFSSREEEVFVKCIATIGFVLTTFYFSFMAYAFYRITRSLITGEPLPL